MRSIATGLGAWASIETGKAGRHGLTFPLALVSATMVEGGYPAPIPWEGDRRPVERARDVDLLLVSAMDPRHFWEIVPWLREVGAPVLARDRAEADPFVLLGGQAAAAPVPVLPFFDVVYVGEAEAHLVELLDVLRDGRRAGWSRRRILEAAAAVPGCLVPSCQPAGHTVRIVEAVDIGMSLRRPLNVSLRNVRRIELARGCRSKCGFCVLGWRTRYRENPADGVIRALRDAPSREVTLSAADAETYSGLREVRVQMAALGLHDHGVNGRLDTFAGNEVTSAKSFSFGLEGMSHRLRRAMGKPKLTDGYIAGRLDEFWRMGGARVLLHMIGGIPTESHNDECEFAGLLALLRDMPRGRRYVTIGRQPLTPMPHTPMQWLAPGLRTDRIGRVVARYAGDPRLTLVDAHGQREVPAILNALLIRGGPETAHVLLRGRPRVREGRLARRQLGAWAWGYEIDLEDRLSTWSTDRPLPWACVESAVPLRSQLRAYRKIREILGLPRAASSRNSSSRSRSNANQE